jgi:hypothetical protein
MTETMPAATISQLLPQPDLGGLEPDPWLTPAADLLGTLIDRLAQRRSGPPHVPTGLAAFDHPDGGLVAGTLTALCAPPGADRTTPLLSAAMHAAEHNHVVVVYALGATAASVGGRLAALASGAPLGRLGAGALTDADMAALVAAQRLLADLALELVVGQTVSSHDIRAEFLSRDDAPQLIVVDNQALLAHGGRASDLKHLAVDLNVAVLCSTTVPACRDGLKPADLDGDLLSAADTLTWAAGGGSPIALFCADDQTATTNIAIGEAVQPQPSARRPTA